MIGAVYPGSLEMSRQSRKQLVLKVLQEHPETRNDNKALTCRVWMEMGAQTLSDVLTMKVSSPSAIDRDRRRVDVLEKFPREEKRFKEFESYLDEFSPAGQWAMKFE